MTKKMIPETLDDLNPRSSGAAARLAAMKEHIKGRPLDQHGREVPDSTPMAPPIGYIPQVSLFDQVRDLVTRHQRELAEAGGETLEEFEDLDVGDDEDYIPESEYENDGDPSIAEINRAVEEHRKASAAAAAPPTGAPAAPPASATGPGQQPAPLPPKNE